MTCQQSVGLFARYLEQNGILTTCVLSREDLAEAVKPPRTLIAKFPYGAPLGPPGDREIQLGILREALALLDTAAAPGERQPSQHRWHT